MLARSKSNIVPDQIPFQEVALPSRFFLYLWLIYLPDTLTLRTLISIVLYYILLYISDHGSLFVVTFHPETQSADHHRITKDLSGIKISMQAVILQGMNDATTRFLSTWFSNLYKEQVQMDVDEGICPTVEMIVLSLVINHFRFG